jgi:hypothetical protein
LTAEKVTGTDLILTPFDYIIWASGGTVNAQNGKTGKIDFSGTDSATVVQFALNQSGVGLVVLQEDIPASTGTITISKSDVSLVCFKTQRDALTPSFRKLLISAPLLPVVSNVMVSGVQFDECQIDAFAGFEINGVLIENCQFNNANQTDRNGIRFTGGGSVKDILFRFCNVRVLADNTWFVSFEGSSDSNGHIKFDRCQFENIGGKKNVDSILYSATGPGQTGAGLVFDSCSFVHSGGTPTGCTIVHLKGTAANAGPRQLVLSDCHFDVSQADLDFLVIELNSNTFHSSVFVSNPCLTVSSGKAYRWIWNKNSTQPDRFVFGSCLAVRRGRQTGAPSVVWALGIPNQTPNFKVIIRDFVGFNPQGAETVVVPPIGSFPYTNDDGVYESLYIRGSVTSIVKDGVTLFTSTPATVDLAPRESVTLNFVGTPPTVVKDRK